MFVFLVISLKIRYSTLTYDSIPVAKIMLTFWDEPCERKLKNFIIEIYDLGHIRVRTNGT